MTDCEAFCQGGISVHLFRGLHKCQARDAAKNSCRDYYLIANPTLHIRDA